MLRRREESRNLVAIVDLDPRMNDEEIMQPREETKSIQLGRMRSSAHMLGEVCLMS